MTHHGFQYLDKLNFRVRSYLQRSCEESAWEKYVANMMPQIVNPLVNERVTEKCNTIVNISKSRKKNGSKPQRYPVSKINSTCKSHKYLEKSVMDQCRFCQKACIDIIQKELVILPRTHDFKKVSEEVAVANPMQSTIETQTPTNGIQAHEKRSNSLRFNSHNNYNYSLSNDCNLSPETDNVLDIKNNYNFDNLNTKVKVFDLHQFEVPPTILFLESFVWEELLQDTAKELEKIHFENQVRRKEQTLNAIRHCIGNLQVEKSLPELESPLEKEHGTLAERISELADGSSSDSTTQGVDTKVKYCKSHLAQPKKAVVQKLDTQKLASIAEGRVKYDSYSQKAWPPISQFQDFHSTSIQVSDSILEDVLSEVVQEFETISGHIVQSCYKQELGDIGNR